ncbi:MAG: hypothetical protein ACP5UK_07140 [Conexivisphaera sp.]
MPSTTAHLSSATRISAGAVSAFSVAAKFSSTARASCSGRRLRLTERSS